MMDNIKDFGSFLNEDRYDKLEKQVVTATAYMKKVADFLSKKGWKIEKMEDPDLDVDGEITFKGEPLLHVTVTIDSNAYVSTEHEDGFKMTDPTDDLESLYAELNKAKADKTKAPYKAKDKAEKSKPWKARESKIDKNFIVYDNEGTKLKIENKKNGKSITVGLYAASEVINALNDLLD